MRSHVMNTLPWALFLTIGGCGKDVPAPKQFQDFAANDGSFSCSAPAGWGVERRDGTRSGHSQCKFRKGEAEIRVESGVAKPANDRPGGEAEAPVAQAHALEVKVLEDEFTNYKERDVQPFTSKGLGEGRKARFAADGGIVGRIYGYHATLLADDRRITVICQCPATSWKALQPAFDRVIESVGR